MGRVAVAIKLRAQVRKQFGSGFTLDVATEFAPGFHILFGPSGAGKTTLLESVAGLLRPDAGKVISGERTLFDAASGVDVPTHLRRAGYVFQSQALFPHLTVLENVGFGSSPEAAERLLAEIGFREMRERRPAELSAGQRQRVALARALASEPEFLLMDEPLGALDAQTKSEIISMLRKWNEQHGVPILYVTHDREEAYGLGERLLVMEEGKIVADGPPQKVLAAPVRTTIAQLAGFENMLQCEIVSDHPEQGTMSCRVTGSEVVLEVPLTRVDGANVVLGLRAGDILVAAERPRAISARNILLGTIESVERRSALVRLLVSVKGAKFEAHITPGAHVALGLSGGKSAWLVIKTYSCHLLNA